VATAKIASCTPSASPVIPSSDRKAPKYKPAPATEPIAIAM
jgi:hypothetical protein